MIVDGMASAKHRQKGIQGKMENYYDNINPDLLNLVGCEAKSILELGCGGGGLAFAIKERLGHPIHYVGIDSFADAIKRAELVLDIALQRNLDNILDWSADQEMADALPLESFDHVICGDVLEHLYAPDLVLKQAVSRLKPGGYLLACIPNVQHWSTFAQLVLGHWPSEDAGLFDRTHIRWFALSNMLELLHQAGLTVEKVIPRIFDEERAVEVLEYLEPLAIHLGVDTDVFSQRALPLQYVLVAKKIVEQDK